MSEFAALITGAVAGALMKSADPNGPFLIEVHVPRDSQGNYLHEVHVSGTQSGEQLRIKVEPLYDTPESVAEKMQGAQAAVDAARRHL